MNSNLKQKGEIQRIGMTCSRFQRKQLNQPRLDIGLVPHSSPFHHIAALFLFNYFHSQSSEHKPPSLCWAHTQKLLNTNRFFRTVEAPWEARASWTGSDKPQLQGKEKESKIKPPYCLFSWSIDFFSSSILAFTAFTIVAWKSSAPLEKNRK